MPIITISRMFGSGGSIIAARVAHELGWPLLDNALVEAVAQRLGVTVDEVAAREERVPSLAERIAAALALGSPESMPLLIETQPRLTPEQLLEVTGRVVEEQVAQGPAVIVGRGAQLMLASREDGLHVFCYAPHEALVRRVAERMRLSHEEAAQRVRETNGNRVDYVRRHWNRNWLDLDNYHLCINTDAFGLDGAVRVVLDAARRKLGAELIPRMTPAGGMPAVSRAPHAPEVPPEHD